MHIDTPAGIAASFASYALRQVAGPGPGPEQPVVVASVPVPALALVAPPAVGVPADVPWHAYEQDIGHALHNNVAVVAVVAVAVQDVAFALEQELAPEVVERLVPEGWERHFSASGTEKQVVGSRREGCYVAAVFPLFVQPAWDYVVLVCATEPDAVVS